MRTYTIKVEEDLHRALRLLKAETVRQILREAIQGEIFKKEIFREFEKQMEYYLSSIELKIKDASKIKNKMDYFLRQNKEIQLGECKNTKIENGRH